MTDLREGLDNQGCPFCGSMTGHSILVNCCPDRTPQPMLPSPNSTFPPEELEEVKECIELANELLLALGLEDENEEINLRAVQLSLRELRGKCLSITIQCGDGVVREIGFLEEAGLDFIILETEVKNLKIIPTLRILSIQHIEVKSNEVNLDQELLCIDDAFRLSLTLNFSEIVSRSPFLLNLFFGLKLRLFLDSYLGCWIYIKADDEQREVEGTLIEVDHRKLVIKNIDDEKQGFDFDDICYVEIERLAFAGLRLFTE